MLDSIRKTICESKIINGSTGATGGLSRGHVYNMSDVYDRHESMCSDTGTRMPMRFQSTRTTFDKKVQLLVGPKASYVQTIGTGSLLMYPGERSDFIISKIMTKSFQEGMFSSDFESAEDAVGAMIEIAQGKIFQQMVHVALKSDKICLSPQDIPAPGNNLIRYMCIK